MTASAYQNPYTRTYLGTKFLYIKRPKNKICNATWNVSLLRTSFTTIRRKSMIVWGNISVTSLNVRDGTKKQGNERNERKLASKSSCRPFHTLNSHFKRATTRCVVRTKNYGFKRKSDFKGIWVQNRTSNKLFENFSLHLLRILFRRTLFICNLKN